MVAQELHKPVITKFKEAYTYARFKDKSVVAVRFIKTLKSKIYKKLTANSCKFYLGYLKNLGDEYSNIVIIILLVKNY